MSDKDVAEKAVLVGSSGSSGLGWSELKDLECTRRYAYIKEAEAKRAASGNTERTPTAMDEAFQCGTFLHAARAKWLTLGQSVDRAAMEQCYAAGKADCKTQGYDITELSTLEYSLLFTNYANYWAIRPKVKPYAVELFLEYDLATRDSTLGGGYMRSTRLDDLSHYPDVDGYCIGEFKTTYNLSGALKYYSEYNPQVLMQQLIYLRQPEPTSGPTHPEIKGTMVDIWDKGKLKGTRHFVPLNTTRLAQFERWLERMLYERKCILHNRPPMRNFFVCNTFNDAYNSQCKFKERCLQDE